MSEGPEHTLPEGQETPASESHAATKRPITVQSLNWVVLAVLVLALFLLIRIRSQPQGPDRAAHPSVGVVLPRLNLVPLTFKGQPVTLADLAGKVVLLNFWATWCGPCKQELPELADLEQRLRGQADVRFLAVACQPPNLVTAAEDTRQVLEDLTIDIPVYADSRETTQNAVGTLEGFEPFYYPTTVILDKKGVIRGVWSGYHPSGVDQMEQLIAQLRRQNA